MEREQIISMAREAGFNSCDGEILAGDIHGADCITEYFERFAALVAAAEREECAKVCDWQTEHPFEIAGDSISCAEAIRERGGA